MLDPRASAFPRARPRQVCEYSTTDRDEGDLRVSPDIHPVIFPIPCIRQTPRAVFESARAKPASVGGTPSHRAGAGATIQRGHCSAAKGQDGETSGVSSVILLRVSTIASGYELLIKFVRGRSNVLGPHGGPYHNTYKRDDGRSKEGWDRGDQVGRTRAARHDSSKYPSRTGTALPNMSSNKIEETQLDSPTNEKKIEIYENEYAQQVPSVGFDPLNVDTKGMTETQLMQVRSAAFAAAVAQDPLNPRSKASFLLYFCV